MSPSHDYVIYLLSDFCQKCQNEISIMNQLADKAKSISKSILFGVTDMTETYLDGLWTFDVPLIRFYD